MSRRLQNLLNNHEENMRKLTNRLNSTQDFENKVKKFFGENEEYHKKRVGELSKGNTSFGTLETALDSPSPPPPLPKSTSGKYITR